MSDHHVPPVDPGFTVTAPLPTGDVVVASDALLAQVDALGHLATSLRHSAGDLTGVVQRLDLKASITSDVPSSAHDARRFAHSAQRALLATADHASNLAEGVRAALVVYEQAEDDISVVGHALEEYIAERLGVAFRLVGVPLAIIAGAGLLGGAAIAGRSPAAYADEIQSFLERHGRILNNPITVRVVRALAANADGFAAGFNLGSPFLASLLRQTGLTGVSSSANQTVQLGREFGLFEPTGESVRKTSAFEYGSAPTSLAQRANSFPDPGRDPNGEQIRIDRYVEPGKPDRFDVYIAGTVTFDPRTGTEPFDLQSDLSGVGQQPTASARAVVDAMRQAGITSHTPVVLNGYSQGGLVASSIAASGKFDVQGVVTFGAPSAQVHLPASIPVLTVRNSEDIVPATSGYDVNRHAVVVTRDAFAHQPVPSDVVVAGHDLRVYQDTAAVVDGSRSSEVRGVLDPLNRFGAGATKVDSTLWAATRVPSAASPSR
jgi:hypothetical protein